MFLVSPLDKTQSSTSLLQFILLDLEYVKENFKCQQLIEKINSDSNFKSYISRDKESYNQKFDEIKIAVLSQHLEIMRQSLFEHIGKLKISPGHLLNGLGLFLFDLRNAFSHTKETLNQKFSERVKTTQPIYIHIPIKKHSDSNIEFCPDSLSSYSLKCLSVPKATINLNMRFIHILYLLSCHILEILKIQKSCQLDEYLNGINGNADKVEFPETFPNQKF